MPRTSPLIRFGFNWSRFPFPSIVPRIPIKFTYTENNQEKTTPLFYAILDSGAEAITIPQRLAESWHLTLTELPDPANTAGGQVRAYKSKIDFSIGQVTARTVKYENIEIYVLPGCPDILVGIHPIFEDYDVNIKASDTRYVLEPRH